MRSWRIAFGAGLALAYAMTPISTLAHAGLVSSSPAAGETLATPPDAVTLVFERELAPDGSGFTVTDPDGVVVGEGGLDLAVAERNQVRGGVQITEPGTYAVAWSAVASDGHEETGDFVFTVRPVEPPPNTAAVPADPNVQSTLGAILLLVGVGIGMWRARRAAS